MNKTIIPILAGLLLCVAANAQTGCAGEDALADWCEGQGPIDLFPYLGGNPVTGGQWTDANFQQVTMPIQTQDIFSEWYYIVETPCSDTAKITLILNPRPEVSIFPGDTTLYVGATLGLLGSGALNYFWSPPGQLSCDACPNPIFVAAETTELTLIGEDVYGCRDTVSLTITVEERKLGFELPKAFTPDGDGVNDRFRTLYEGMPFKSFHLRIFSRWGEMVFETSNPATGWDGAFKGKPLPADVYAYWLVYTLADDAEGTEKGEVTLMR